MSREFGAGTDGGTSAPESGAGPPRNEHPTPEELLAFHFGALDAVDREGVEDHLSRCPECAEVVLDFAAFPELEPVGEMTPEQQRTLAAQRRRLRELARDDSLSEAGTGATGEEGEARDGKVIPGPWRRRLRTAWGVAAVFFAATVGLSLWMAARTPSVSTGAPIVASVSTERGPEDVLEIPFEEPLFLVMTVGPTQRDFPEYRLDLLAESGERVYSEAGLHLGDGGSLGFNAPRRWQPPGRYTFEVYGLRGSEAVKVGSLPVELLSETPAEIR